jgi:hypothetical protein
MSKELSADQNKQFLLVMGIGNIFKIDDRYINIDRWSIIGDNGLAKCIYWL